jgi:phospholipase/carboxylesterase
MDEVLPAIEVETAENPQFTVIWMHGLGADGSDFEFIVPELGLEDYAVRFVFPHAPMIKVSCNGGYMMRAWYDIISLDSDSRQIDDAGIAESRQAIRRLIAREIRRGIACHRIFIAGFSQGGAIAYATVLTHPEKLAGAIALSCYIPNPGVLTAETTEANKATPIFAAHGTSDDLVSFSLGVAARNLLLQHGYPLEWHDYPMSHSVCPEEIAAIGDWLRKTMAVCRGESS